MNREFASAPQDAAALEREAASWSRVAAWCSRVRLASFFLLALAIYLGMENRLWLFLPGLPALAAFVAAFVIQDRAFRRRDQAAIRLTLLREMEERRTDRRRQRAAPAASGESLPLELGLRIYAPEAPCFTLDERSADELDVLSGRRSLFGILDASSTAFGARRLARFLTHPLSGADAIRSRQAAVRELASRAGLRGSLLENLAPWRGVDFQPAPRAIRQPAWFPHRAGQLAFAHASGTLLPLLLLLSIAWPQLLAAAGLLLIIHLAISASQAKKSNPALRRLLLIRSLADALLEIQEIFEREAGAAPLRSEELEELRRTLDGARPALLRLRRAMRPLGLHDYGVVFEWFNLLFLWELRFLPLAEGRLESGRESLERAAGCLGELEALLSLSCAAVEQVGFILPEAAAGSKPFIEAHAMGHPLLDPGAAVRNDLVLGDPAAVWIITGSNMAGKSTFLKAAGANLILAGAGAPVCAERFRWTPLEIHSDLNVRDSLDDGKSYFQVEVERIRDFLRAAETGPMRIGIFDELFRGTNSIERLAICQAILSALAARGMLVLVATHDLSIADLAGRDGDRRMLNRHFSEEVSGGAMTFSYRLQEGPAPSRNAIRVLEVSGYPEAVIEDARRRAGREEPLTGP